MTGKDNEVHPDPSAPTPSNSCALKKGKVKDLLNLNQISGNKIFFKNSFQNVINLNKN